MKFLILLILTTASISLANTRPVASGGPGMVGVWSRPDKEGFLATVHQNVWATIADGILTEVYYPRLDVAQTKDTELLFLIGKNFLEERRDFAHKVTRYGQSLAYHVSSYNSQYQIQIEKDIALDPQRPAVVLTYSVSFAQPVKDAKIYVLHNPSADNTAGGDAAVVNTPEGKPGEILAYQSDRRGDEPSAFAKRTTQLLVLSHPATEGSVGFEGVNDPWTQLHNNRSLHEFGSAQGGNVAAALGFPVTTQQVRFRVALEFSQDTSNFVPKMERQAFTDFQQPPAALISAQQQEWNQYFLGLNPIGKRFESHVLVLKGLEDKTYPGAIIAGPALPALPTDWASHEYDYESARLRRGDSNGGYHRVWPRDLVQMGLGLLAAGDKATPVSVARYLARIQLPNGNFPQNTWVDGTPSWTGFQLDQTGLPIVLISRLAELGLLSYSEYRGMVIKAADALVHQGPWTQQERWEENGGLSPNSIAAACQGLLEASWLEKSLDATKSKLYENTCNKWRSQIFDWTFIENGPLGQGYFERMELGNDPTHSILFKIHNNPAGGDTFPENSIIDGGFIQLIISGLLNPIDHRFGTSLAVYDRVARGPAPVGQGYLRYNHDGYGTHNMGKTWPLLAGERAIAAISRHEDPSPFIQTMMSSVTPAGMLCEQVDVSACPLGWAHAEVLLVARSSTDKKSFYLPRRLDGYH